MMYRKTFPQEEEKQSAAPTAYSTPSCRFTEGVSCSVMNRQCWKCGHNPVVARARLEAFCKKHGIDVPNRKE